MKLGGKARDVDSFVDQLKSEGQQVTNLTPTNNTSSTVAAKVTKQEHTEDVHLRLEDRLNIRIGRDGGLQSFELSGLLTLRISDEKFGRIKVQMANNDRRGIQLQVNIDLYLPPILKY